MIIHAINCHLRFTILGATIIIMLLNIKATSTIITRLDSNL